MPSCEERHEVRNETALLQSVAAQQAVGKTDHMDYGARAAAYVDAFMQNIVWDGAVKRLPHDAVKLA